MNDFVPCPFCNELIKPDAISCYHCGSDKETGWSGSHYEESFDLDFDDDFDYDDMVEKEFGKKQNSNIKSFSFKNNKADNKREIIIIITSLLLLISLVTLFLQSH